ncbi:MAG: amidase family protein, partial [Thermomicrobiales bacterium]
ARKAAATADIALACGENSALLGLPITTKDTNLVAGIRVTAGDLAFANHVAEHDAPIIAAARAAGAVIIGKTNVPPWAGDFVADNPVFGRTNNPWDLARTPGGSTGGGAAALAAGMTPLEFGSDIGGSVRLPAVYCGVFGHKSSETALPKVGMSPRRTRPNAARVLAVMGPLARSAQDLALAVDVVAGPAEGEDVAWRLALPAARHDQLADYRIAVLPWPEWVPLDDEIRLAWEGLVSGLSRHGAHVAIAQPEGFADLRAYHDLYLRLFLAQWTPSTPLAEREARMALLRDEDDLFVRAQADVIAADIGNYLDWHGRREDYRAAYRLFFRDWDVLLMPASLVPAFPHSSSTLAERMIAVNGKMAHNHLQLVCASVATLTGQPATAFPVSLTRSGLPIGLQAVGPYLEDHTPIRFAGLVEQEFGGFRPPPGYDSLDRLDNGAS